MRITSGAVGGRLVSVPKGIRPTQDRVREAYFSKIADILPECRFLDLYAGSGAVGLEAWSRGASECLLVDFSRAVLKVAQSNCETLADGAVRCMCAEVMRYLDGSAGRAFQLIYADPPYVMADDSDFAAKLLGLIKGGSWLAEDGIVTIERRAGKAPSDVADWRVMDSRKYGESALDFYVLAGKEKDC